MIRTCIDTATQCYTAFNRMDGTMKVKSVVVCLSTLAMGSFTIWMGCRSAHLWSQGLKGRSITWIGATIMSSLQTIVHTIEMIKRFNGTYRLAKDTPSLEATNAPMFTLTNSNIRDIVDFVFKQSFISIGMAGVGAVAINIPVLIYRGGAALLNFK